MKQFFTKFARKNQIYIVPNGNGIVYGAINLIILIAAATFSNNLVYMLAFMMFAVALIGMVQSHINLKGIEVIAVKATDTYEGEVGHLLVQIRNDSRHIRQNIWIDPIKEFRSEGRSGGHLSEVLPGRIMALSVRSQGWKRGIHRVPPLLIKTRYPLGLFTAWKVERSEARIYVYPKATGDLGLNQAPKTGQEIGHSQTVRVGQGVEFNEHKRFADGDSYRHVDWKVFARKRILLKKDFDGEGSQVFSFNFSSLNNLSLEEKLSQLSYWIKCANAAHIAYELILPSLELPLGAGDHHLKLCQRELAKVEALG